MSCNYAALNDVGGIDTGQISTIRLLVSEMPGLSFSCFLVLIIFFLLLLLSASGSGRGDAAKVTGDDNSGE